MAEFLKSIIPLIESKLGQLTPSESKIAEYFLFHSHSETDLSAQSVAKRLQVSESGLTRFAKKLGFKGFREFIFHYGQPTVSESDFVQPVLSSYQELLNKTYSIVNMNQIHRVTQLLLNQSRVYIYGKGSSGLAAKEMKLRFMRIGLICEALTDDDMIKMNAGLIHSDCLVIGISVSGKTQVVLEALFHAKKQKAATVLLTGHSVPQYQEQFDEVLLIALKNQLDNGRIISPQFPVLLVLDILYADYLNTNKNLRDKIWQKTYDFLNNKG